MWRRQLPARARALCCAGNDDVWQRDCGYQRARKPQRWSLRRRVAVRAQVASGAELMERRPTSR